MRASRELSIYDLTGRRIARLIEGPLAEGRHSVPWDGRDLPGKRVPAGIYSYRLKTATLDERSMLVVVR